MFVAGVYFKFDLLRFRRLVHAVVDPPEPSVVIRQARRSHLALFSLSRQSAPGFGDSAVSRTLSVGHV